MAIVFGMQMVLFKWTSWNLGPLFSQSVTLEHSVTFETTVKKHSEAQEHFATM
jgi:hypothetical protein